MDMRKFSGEHFIKVADVEDDPIRAVIAVVKMGKYDKPDLVFESGDVLSLNATNNQTLVRAYGANSDDWIGKEVQLLLGEIEYQGRMQKAVKVKPISPPPKPADQKSPEPDFNDDLPDFDDGTSFGSSTNRRVS